MTSSDITPTDVEQQLLRIVDSHQFRHSHRYPALLKYLVEQTLAGHGGELKERLLGIEVFHRAPDYDTNTDPVVRVTAAEVRKRIAQYYQEPGHGQEIRIEVPTGSYVPHFLRPPAPTPPATLESAHAAAPLPEEPAATDAKPTHADNLSAVLPRKGVHHLIYWPHIALALCIGVLLGLTTVRAAGSFALWRERALRDFWAPISGGDTPVFVVIGDHTVGSTGNALRASQGAALNPSEDVLRLMNDYQQVTVSDVTSLFHITEYMVRHDKRYNAQGAGGASFDDLRKGPVLLFAGLDNRWTMRLCERLPFRFVDSADDSIGTIEDAKNPAHRWRVDFNVPYNQLPVDYAIVARYYDTMIEQPVILVAGIGQTGTVTASEFVTSERDIEELNKLAPKGWSHENVEVVLETDVIDGHPGPPHIVASRFW
jgi:hypothetical protein